MSMLSEYDFEEKKSMQCTNSIVFMPFVSTLVEAKDACSSDFYCDAIVENSNPGQGNAHHKYKRCEKLHYTSHITAAINFNIFIKGNM